MYKTVHVRKRQKYYPCLKWIKVSKRFGSKSGKVQIEQEKSRNSLKSSFRTMFVKVLRYPRGLNIIFRHSRRKVRALHLLCRNSNFRYRRCKSDFKNLQNAVKLLFTHTESKSFFRFSVRKVRLYAFCKFLKSLLRLLYQKLLLFI